MASGSKKKPDLITLGSMEKEAGGTLFKDRLKREGRLDDFEKSYREKFGDSIATFGDPRASRFWWETAREFGYVDLKHERELYEKYMLEGSMVKDHEEALAVREEIREEAKEEEVKEATSDLPATSCMDLPADIAWVYAHPAMLRKCEGVAELKPTDYNGAPNKGAVGMLVYAMNNKRDFYKLVLSHLSKKDAAGEIDKDMEDDLRDIKEIEAMLNQL